MTTVILESKACEIEERLCFEDRDSYDLWRGSRVSNELAAGERGKDRRRRLKVGDHQTLGSMRWL